MADRILVMHRGAMVAEFARGVDAASVMRAAGGLVETGHAH
jgi:hypothetical protein